MWGRLLPEFLEQLQLVLGHQQEHWTRPNWGAPKGEEVETNGQPILDDASGKN